MTKLIVFIALKIKSRATKTTRRLALLQECEKSASYSHRASARCSESLKIKKPFQRFGIVLSSATSAVSAPSITILRVNR